MKEYLSNKQHYTLYKIIVNDLIKKKKLAFLLFIFIIITALMIVITTYYTRLLTVQREQILQEHNTLDIEWHHLILEKNVLGEHYRIERIAIKKLKMQHVDPLQENIILQK